MYVLCCLRITVVVSTKETFAGITGTLLAPYTGVTQNFLDVTIHVAEKMLPFFQSKMNESSLWAVEIY